MATAVVSVHVLDRNEFPPVLRRRRYAGRVSEAAAAGALVADADAAAQLGAPLVLDADDGDSPANRQRAYEILEPSAAARFRIDPTTGALRLATQLDYEEAAVHEFTVRVRYPMFAVRAKNISPTIPKNRKAFSGTAPH